ncbi:MAG: four helix bundle protein [Thermoguttaceae bacterium]|jgi:four helix bundle protein
MNLKDKMDLVERTTNYALRIIHLYTAIPKNIVGKVIGKQLLRSGTSVGAQYREARRSRSAVEFVSKLGIGLQELEETGYWLELLAKSKVIPAKRLSDLREETNELIAIFVSSANTAKLKRKTG